MTNSVCEKINRFSLTGRELYIDESGVVGPDTLKTALPPPEEIIRLAAFEHPAKKTLHSVEKLVARHVKVKVSLRLEARSPLLLTRLRTLWLHLKGIGARLLLKLGLEIKFIPLARFEEIFAIVTQIVGQHLEAVVREGVRQLWVGRRVKRPCEQ